MLSSNQMHMLFFNGLFAITILLNVLIYFQTWNGSAATYLAAVASITEMYISLFLIWQFNPLRSPKPINALQRQIIFSGGLFIFTSSLIGTTAKTYLDAKI
jgi:hypothetical protein